MALGRLSSQANNSMGYARILAGAVSNPGLPIYSFDDINTFPLCYLSMCLLPLCYLLRQQSGKRHSSYVINMDQSQISSLSKSITSDSGPWAPSTKVVYGQYQMNLVYLCSSMQACWI